MKKRIAVFLAALMLLSLCGCKSKAAKETDELILKIGEVTASSTDEVERAQSAYDALSDKEKEQVENYAVLEQAQKDLAEAKRTRAISEFEKFVKNNPYKKPENSMLFETDAALIEKYAERASTLRELGITEEECPALSYASIVEGLADFDKYKNAEIVVLTVYSRAATAIEYEKESYTETLEAPGLIQKAIDELDLGLDAVEGVIDMDAYGVKTLINAAQELHEKYELLYSAYYEAYFENDNLALMSLILNGTVDPSTTGVSSDAMEILNEVSDKAGELPVLLDKLDEKYAELFD